MSSSIDLYGDGIGTVELINHMGNDKTIVEAARVSYNKDRQDDRFDDVKDPKLIRYLMKNRHTSPFEHCQITWRFEVPLFVRGQHHRHRTWAYNEVSRRYTSEALKFFTPKTFRSQPDKGGNKQVSNEDEINPVLVSWDHRPRLSAAANIAVERHVKSSLDLYEEMLEQGIAREQARMVLPQNMYTAYYGSVNLHNAFHFVGLRAHPHAQWEIRRVAEAMLEHLTELYPVATAAFKDLRLNSDVQ